MIKTEDIEKLKKSQINHIFKYDLDYVWDHLKKSPDFYTIIHDPECKIEFQKGKSLYEKDAEYSIILTNNIKLNFKIIFVEDKLNYKRLQTFNDFTHLKMRNYCDLIFERVTIDKSTVMKCKWWTEQELSTDHENYNYEERMKMILRFDGHFSQNIKEIQEQFESISLNCNLNLAWKIITNWKIFQKIIPDLCDEVEYEGVLTQVDSVMKLKWFIKKKAKCVLKVIKINYEPDKDNVEYQLLCIDSSPEIPKQEIHFKISEINQSSCLLLFKHIYLEKTSQEIILGVSQYKKKILKTLQRNINKLLEIIYKPSHN